MSSLAVDAPQPFVATGDAPALQDLITQASHMWYKRAREVEDMKKKLEAENAEFVLLEEQRAKVARRADVARELLACVGTPDKEGAKKMMANAMLVESYGGAEAFRQAMASETPPPPVAGKGNKAYERLLDEHRYKVKDVVAVKWENGALSFGVIEPKGVPGCPGGVLVELVSTDKTKWSTGVFFPEYHEAVVVTTANVHRLMTAYFEDANVAKLAEMAGESACEYKSKLHAATPRLLSRQLAEAAHDALTAAVPPGRNRGAPSSYREPSDYVEEA